MGRIEVRDVSLSYSGGGGVSGVSLDIEDGEYVALLGPSGSGKTTLLRLIGGFLAPDSGSVAVAGNPVAGGERGKETWVPPERRGLGMVFQQHAIWPHMSVARNVEYPLKRSRAPKDERRQRVSEALELVGLAQYAERPPDTLSGGQQQRVALARALVMRPQALLLDEPLASLDAALKERLRVELGALTGRAGTTVVHVTHDRAEALGLADRVAVLRDGVIEQVAAPRELLASPATPFVAGFVADAALLAAELRDGRLVIAGGDGEIPVETLDGQGGPVGSGTLALRPQDVYLVAGDEAEVRAALYTGDALEVYLSWQGNELRARAPADATYRSGDRVSPIVEQGIFFPDAANGDAQHAHPRHLRATRTPARDALDSHP